MRIPHTHLSSAALRAVVQEFVTRDGTDHSSVERRMETVLRQLDAGCVELHFDVETEYKGVNARYAWTIDTFMASHRHPPLLGGGSTSDRCPASCRLASA
jgi:uncharacterized protein YheU (UPF0270 family)